MNANKHNTELNNMKTLQETYSEISKDQRIINEGAMEVFALSYFLTLVAMWTGGEIKKIRNSEIICDRLHPQHFYKNIRHSVEWRECFRDNLKQYYIDGLVQFKNALNKCSKSENPEKCKKLLNGEI